MSTKNGTCYFLVGTKKEPYPFTQSANRKPYPFKDLKKKKKKKKREPCAVPTKR